MVQGDIAGGSVPHFIRVSKQNQQPSGSRKVKWRNIGCCLPKVYHIQCCGCQFDTEFAIPDLDHGEPGPSITDPIEEYTSENGYEDSGSTTFAICRMVMVSVQKHRCAYQCGIQADVYG